MKRIVVFVAGLSCLAGAAYAQPRIVAAENFYGDVARQLAGPRADVSSILRNPDDDPHLFEASPSVARALASADIVVANGAGYDPWIDRLLTAQPKPGRRVIVVADLLGRKIGDNPHLWYDPAAMPALARALTAALEQTDPSSAALYRSRLAAFERSLTPMQAEIQTLRSHVAGIPVTATEPVFGLMAEALRLDMHDQAFQIAVMNETEPTPGQTGAIESELRGRRVRVLLYNTQATDDAARRLLGLAHAGGVPVVGVTETEPAGMDYQQWMTHQLDALAKALSAPAS